MSTLLEKLYQIYLEHPFIQTDTRKLRAGEVFFALKGDNFNGNLFAKEALERGAVAVIVDEDIPVHDERIIRTNNALETLQELAGYHRRQFKIPFIAITGSNGKTTTKELIHAVLSSHYKTYTTEGNLNNHIGIPLTLLKIRKDAEIAVIEMGANHQREIAGYCTYVQPTHGLINNVGKAHLEGFGGIEGVKKGKGELYDNLRDSGGQIFINTDLDYLEEMSRGIQNRYTYGTGDADIKGLIVSSDPFLTVQILKPDAIEIIHTRLVGDYNLPNVLAAVAVGTYFKVPPEKIHHALEAYLPSNSRSQLIHWKGNEIILDAYNANPSSMKAAVENFVHYPGQQKILMLGAMAELGSESISEHQQLIQLIRQNQWQEVVLVGGDFDKIEHPFLYFQNSDQAAEWFEKQQFSEATILVKGSRSGKMEKILRSCLVS